MRRPSFFPAAMLLAALPAILGADGAAPPAEGRFAMPLDELRQTSSFGESRGLRLHAGLDFSTGGRIGLPVYAAAAGRVTRLKVSRDGYGHALYLEHDGGLVSVYAHLDRFEDERLGLQTLLWKERRRTGFYFPGDIYPDPPPRVERGQLIAWSGDSGEGLPHLHFEFRRGMEQALSPREAGFVFPAPASRPVIEALRFVPLSADARLDGLPMERRVVFGAKEPPALRIWGEWELLAEGHVPCGTGSRCGWSGWGAKLGEAPLFEAEPRSFSYVEPPWGGWLFDLARSSFGRGAFVHRMRLIPAGAAGLKTASTLSVREEGSLPLVVFARSESGLSAERRLILKGTPPALGLETAEAPTAPGAAPSLKLHPFAWGAVAEIKPAGAWTLRLRDGSGGTVMETSSWSKAGKAWGSLALSRETSGGTLELLYPRQDKAAVSLPLRYALLEQKRPVSFAAGEVSLVVPPQAPEAGLLLWHEVPAALDVSAGLKASAFFSLRPEGLPFREAAQASWPLPAGTREARRYAFYRKDFINGKWKYISSRVEGGMLKAELSWSGTCAVMRDMEAPSLKAGLPSPGGTVSVARRRWHAAATDTQSGVDPESIRFVLDGKSMRGEIHPSRNEIFLDLDFIGVKLEAGEHRLEIRAVDRAGNETVLGPFTFHAAP